MLKKIWIARHYSTHMLHLKEPKWQSGYWVSDEIIYILHAMVKKLGVEIEHNECIEINLSEECIWLSR